MEEQTVAPDEWSSEQAPPIDIQRVRQPRAAWKELLLLLCTFSFYASFLMVTYVRALKSIGKKDFTPWLWLFVPLFPLLQIFGLQRFFRDLTRLEDGSTTRIWTLFTWLWILLLAGINLLIYFEDHIGLPDWVIIAGLVLICLLFMQLHQRMNQWREGLQDVEFDGSSSNYTWYEWIALAIGGSFFALAFYVTFIEPAFVEKIRTLQDKQIVEHKELGFSLTIAGDGWIEVESGTHTSDETELELSGPSLGNYFIVFDHGISYSINEIAQFRAELRDEFSGTPKCVENRSLAKDQKSVISVTECNGSSLGELVTTYSTIIKSNDRLIELYGYLSAGKYGHQRASRDMKEMARGFSPS